MSRRPIDGVPPRYPASEELDAGEASQRLRLVIRDFFDYAERIITAREEFKRRLQTELNAWADAERERLGLDGMTIPGAPPDLIPQTESRVRAEVLSEFGIMDLDGPPRLQVRAAAGLGKTTVVIKELIERQFWHSRHVHIYLPTIALAEELSSNFPSDRHHVRVIRGRSNGAPHNPMCAKYKTADRAAKLGLNVYGTLCKRGGAHGRELVCTYYDTCPYIAQLQDTGPGIRIFAQDYLALPRPQTEGLRLPEPDLIIIDENAVSKLTGTFSFGIDRLDGPALDAVRDHLEHGTDLRQGLRDRGVTARSARKAAAEIHDQIETGVRPDMPEREARRRMDEAKQIDAHKLVQFWLRIAAEVNLDRPFHGVEICPDEQVRVEGLERQHRIHVHWPRRAVIGQKTPLLMIDADADLEINRIFFGPTLQSVEINAARNAHVIQCSSTRLSKRTLLGPQPKLAPAVTGALRKVVNVIKSEAERGGKVLVVMPRQVRILLTADDQQETNGGKQRLQRSETWQGVEIAHFNNIRGSDDWAGHDTVIIVGREEPSPIVIDRLARAIWADDPKPLQFVGVQKFPVEPRGYRLRDGSQQGVKTPLHPDPRAQRRLELIREKEMVQAIDRLRLIHANRAKRVIILCSIPLDITVDELRTFNELAGNRNPLDGAPG